MNRMTDRCKNITLATTPLRPVINQMILFFPCNLLLPTLPMLYDKGKTQMVLCLSVQMVPWMSVHAHVCFIYLSVH